MRHLRPMPQMIYPYRSNNITLVAMIVPTRICHVPVSHSLNYLATPLGQIQVEKEIVTSEILCIDSRE